MANINPIINFLVNNQSITQSNRYAPVEGAQNYIKAKFDFSEEWQDMAKTVAFITNKKKIYSKVLDAENTCIVPCSWLIAPNGYVGVVGTKEDVKITTNTATVVIRHTSFIGTETITDDDTTKTIFDDIMAYYAKTVETISDIEKTVLDVSSNLEERIEKYFSENLDKIDVVKGEDGYTPVKGVDYWTTEDIEDITKEVNEIGNKLNNIDISLSKTDTTTTVALTNKDNGVKTVQIQDGKDGKDFTYSDFTEEQLANLKGEKGESFTYADFTEEQLADLKGEQGIQGEQGKDFTYADFTEEQLANLKGEKGDKGEAGKNFTYSDFTDEQLAKLKGEKGDKGDAFTYADFTIEQLENLKGEQGEKGDAFTYADFTKEQLKNLKGEQGEKGADGKSFTYSDFTEEQLAELKGDRGERGEAFTYSDFTEEQLADLKGEQGEKGEAGKDFTYADFTEEQLTKLKGEKGEAFIYSDFTEEQLENLKGERGEQGENGRDFTYDDFTDEQLANLRGEKGEDGYTPVKGTDYYTNSEIESLENEISTKLELTVNDKVATATDTIKQDVTTLAEEVETSKANITEIDTLAQNNKSNIDTLKSTSTTNTNDIIKIKENIVSIDDTLESTTTEITAINNTIGTIETNVDTNTKDITDLKSNGIGKASENFLFPDMSNLTPIKTIEFSVSDTSLYEICQKSNNNIVNADDILDVLWFRVTVNSDNNPIWAMYDVTVMFGGAIAFPEAYAYTRLLNTSTTYAGIRNIKFVTPTSVNSGYNWAIELQSYNTLERQVKIEVFKTNDTITWNDEKTNSHFNASYHNATNLNLLVGRGMTSLSQVHFNTDYATTSGQAPYITSYLPKFINVNFYKTGEQVYANNIVFSNAGKLYSITNTEEPIDIDTGLMIVGASINVNVVVPYTSLRDRFTCDIKTGNTYATINDFEAGDKVYLCCTFDGTNIYSTGIISNIKAKGYTWIYLGVAVDKSKVAFDLTHSKFYTLSSEGSLLAIDGYPLIN